MRMVRRGAAAHGMAAFDLYPARPLGKQIHFLVQLRDAALGTNAGPSSLCQHHLGDVPISDIIHFNSAVVPRDQRDTKATSAVLLRCDQLLYAAALAVHN